MTSLLCAKKGLIISVDPNSNNIVLYASLQNNMASNTTNNITYSANGTPVVQSAQPAAPAFVAPPRRRTGDNQRIAVLESRMDAYERGNRRVGGERIGTDPQQSVRIIPIYLLKKYQYIILILPSVGPDSCFLQACM